MEAPSEPCLRHFLNKLVNFKAVNLLLQHVHNFVLNQSFKLGGKKISLVYSHKVAADEVPCKRIRAESCCIQCLNTASFAYYIGLICCNSFWGWIKFKNGTWEGHIYPFVTTAACFDTIFLKLRGF